MKSLCRSFAIAFSMYSKIPMPKVDWTKENMKYALCFFPLVGIVIGIFLCGWYYVSSLLGMSRVFTSVVAVLIPILISGGIHLDGLLDTADALSSYQTMERKLEILKDSHAGAFAIIVCCVYFLLDFGIWYEITTKEVFLVSIGFVLSRSLSGFSLVTFRCAKNSGLAATFAEGALRKRVRITMVCYISICAIALLWLEAVLGIIVLGMALLVFAYYRMLAYTKFGGITGDIAGFFLQICELMILFGVVIGVKLCG